MTDWVIRTVAQFRAAISLTVFAATNLTVSLTIFAATDLTICLTVSAAIFLAHVASWIVGTTASESGCCQ
jgi:hypothetical protein